MAILKERGWDTGVWLLGPASDSVVRPATYVVLRGLHKDGSVKMAPIDFMNDLSTDWYTIISGGKKHVPLMVVDGVVYSESVPMVTFLTKRFPDPTLADTQAESACKKWIDMAMATKDSNDALLKHFGFCAMAPGAKAYRSKGGTSGEGLEWVQSHLRPLHDCFTELEATVGDGKYLLGNESLLPTVLYVHVSGLCTILRSFQFRICTLIVGNGISRRRRRSCLVKIGMRSRPLGVGSSATLRLLIRSWGC